jgi:hypothetical protein
VVLFLIISLFYFFAKIQYFFQNSNFCFNYFGSWLVSTAQSAQNQNAVSTAQKTETKSVEKKSITDLKKELAVRLQELNYKKKLADNREKFLQTDENLLNLQKELKNEEKTGAFEAQSAKIVFQGAKGGYRHEDLFAISNVTMILKFIDFCHFLTAR